MQEIPFRGTALVDFKTRVDFPFNKYFLVLQLHMEITR